MTAHRINQQHASWLEKRGILEAALATGVLSGTGLGGGEAIRIPYGNGWSKVYQPNTKEPWKQDKPKNAKLPLWRLDQIDFDKTWLITEGEWDALSAYQVGVHNVTSIPDGAVQPKEENPYKSGKLECIRSAWDKIGKSSGMVVLALDNDECGRVTREVLIDIFGRWRCADIEYPEHPEAKGMNGRCKDLNEILTLFGKAKLVEVLKAKKPLQLEGVFKPKEITRGAPRSYYDIGIDGLERHISLFRGELCVMTGRTGHGKTTFLFNVLGNLAKIHGLQIGLGTFEAEFWEDIHPWYETWLFGDKKPPTSYYDTTEWLEDNFTIISHQVKPLSKQADIDWFLQQAYDAKGRYGIDVLVLDPWNKVQHRRNPVEQDTDYIGRALSELRNFAVVTNTIVIVSAHPTKDSNKNNGKPRIPDEYDIHGSANWGNAADHVVVAFRPDKELTDCCIAVQKSRFRKAGVEGRCWFTFSYETNRYEKMAEHLWPSSD